MSKRITAVLGDFYHDRDLAVKSFQGGIERLKQETNIELDVTYLSVSELINNIKTNPDVIVLFAENRLNPEDTDVKRWMTAEDAKIINDYVKNGGSWLAWHAGLASYENIEEYTSMLKGYFLHHPDKHQVVTYTTDFSSEYFSPDEKFKFLDEHYFVQVEEDQTNIFLKSESVDGSSLAGWYHGYGKGKVLCLTPAHIEEGLMNPTFLKVFAKSIKWCCEVGI